MSAPRALDNPGRVLLDDSIVVLYLRLDRAGFNSSIGPFPPDGVVEGDSGSPKPYVRIRRENPTDTGFPGLKYVLHGLR